MAIKNGIRWGVAILVLALAGCFESESTSNRETHTEVSCSSDRVCDFNRLLCTSIFDEIFTTFIDEYDIDFDLHTTITDDLEVRRTDDIDVFETVLASTQTEVWTTTTREELISIDAFGHEDSSITVVTTVTVTTSQQDCPTCFVEVCSATNGGIEQCDLETQLREFPVCQ